jgi:hypothetical protein
MDLVEELFALLGQQGLNVFDKRITGGGLTLEAVERVLAGVALTPQRAKRVRFVRGRAGDQFLYVLESSSKKGFWGPDKNVIDALARQTNPWSLVLLHGSSTCGYWFPSAVVLSKAASDEWRLGKDGYSYKVNAPNQVTLGERFITPKKIFTLIDQANVKIA